MSSLETERKNVEIVKTMLANGIVGRWDIVRPLVSDELIVQVPEGLPYGGAYRGWDGYMKILQALSFWTDLSVGPNEFATSGNKVVVISHWNGRIAKNGKQVSMPLTEIWEIKDGQVAKITAFYFDTKAIADLAAQ